MKKDQTIIQSTMQRKGRTVFLLMLMFFLVPIIVVIMMYQFNWKPNGVSLGELVKPPKLLSVPKDIQESDKTTLNPLFWKEKWSVVFIADACEKICLSKLKDMRQLHVSLYKDIERTQRVLITTSQNVSQIKHDFPDLIVINQPLTSISYLSQQFNINNENAKVANRLYLVDPLGHLMMSYQMNVPLVNVRKDLTRLLRYSWAG